MKAVEDKRVAWETFQTSAIYILDGIENVAEGEELIATPNTARNPCGEPQNPIVRPWNTPNYSVD